LLALLMAATMCGRQTPPPAKEKPLELEPMKIHEKPIISFAIDIVVYASPDNKAVTRIFITRVLPGTDAERAGLRQGDEIISLDGTPAKGMDPVIAAESPLGRLLLNRPPGDSMKFEVFTRRVQDHTLRAPHGQDAGSFGLDLLVYAQPETKRVDRMFIGRVWPGSDAEKAGLRTNDEILKLDGAPVQGMVSPVTPDSALGRLLLNRKPGDALRFETAILRTQEFTLRAQRGLPFGAR
jgi:C-terminal processing protease CtpA/Prc